MPIKYSLLDKWRKAKKLSSIARSVANVDRHYAQKNTGKKALLIYFFFFLNLLNLVILEKKLRRGVKEVIKAIRKKETGIVILAGDISPIIRTYQKNSVFLSEHIGSKHLSRVNKRKVHCVKQLYCADVVANRQILSVFRPLQRVNYFGIS